MAQQNPWGTPIPGRRFLDPVKAVRKWLKEPPLAPTQCCFPSSAPAPTAPAPSLLLPRPPMTRALCTCCEWQGLEIHQNFKCGKRKDVRSHAPLWGSNSELTCLAPRHEWAMSPRRAHQALLVRQLKGMLCLKLPSYRICHCASAHSRAKPVEGIKLQAVTTFFYISASQHTVLHR